MKNRIILTLLTLTILAGCSSGIHHHRARHLASVDEALSDVPKLQSRVKKLTDGIFHSYMMGQTFLNDFDKQLDKDPSGAMQSESYYSLLALRSQVDKFEHDINDLYLSLVVAQALPHYSELQKQNAQLALDSIGNFMKGVTSDNKVLSENLKPLILGNLHSKQMLLNEELETLKNDSLFTDNNSNVKKTLHQNQVLLRATRLDYDKGIRNYKLDPIVFLRTLKEEQGKESYKELESQIKKLSTQIKEYASELGRGTSSDVIYPSTGSNGNISGSGYPANTWSITFDDGPGPTTTQVINNLKEKKMKATFFVLAQQVERNTRTSLLLKEEGHDIASHSYTHAQLTKVNDVQLDKEISTAKKTIEKHLNVQVKLFRLPYGAGTGASRIRSKIAENDLVHIFWTVDTLDWQDKNPQSILIRTLKQMNASSKNAGIILFHDIHKQSVIASGLLMDHLNNLKKVNVCTVQGVVDQLNNNLPSCK